jgi:DNA-binding beta-propeller fold protein YncE
MIRCILHRSCVTAAATLTLALAPLGLSAAPNVAVPTGEAHRVLIIDSAIDRIVGEIDGINNSHGLAAAPDGNRLYAGSLEMRAAAQVPPKPAGISEDEHRAHHAPAAEAGAKMAGSGDLRGTAYQIDSSDRRILRQIDLPGPVHHALITRDGRYGISTHPGGGNISVVDLDSGELAGVVATGPVANYVISNGDGSRLWVSNTGNGTVSEIDTSRWIVRRNLLVDQAPEHMVLSPDESSLYVVANGAGQVVELDIDSGEVVRRHPVGQDPHGLDISDDGSQLYVSVMGANRLAAIQLATGVIRTLPLGPAPYHLVTVKDTGKIYVSSRSDPKLWVVSQRDLQLVGEIPITGIGHQMALLNSAPETTVSPGAGQGGKP